MSDSEYLPYQQRVIDEKRELDDRFERLSDFIDSGYFKHLPESEQLRLNIQIRLMRDYSWILGQRIAAFKKQEVKP